MSKDAWAIKEAKLKAEEVSLKLPLAVYQNPTNPSLNPCHPKLKVIKF
jgi:hypothetical protein